MGCRVMLSPNELLIFLLIGVSAFSTEGSHGDSSTENCTLSLNLTNVGLRSLPDGFVKNEFLTRLTLDQNEISTVASQAFAFVPRLSHLSLANNKFQSLDLHPFSELPSLETLILNGNCKRGSHPYPNQGRREWTRIHLRIHGENFCKLNFDSSFASLTHLFLEDNNLRELTFSSVQLPVLTHLYLSHNPIQMTETTMFGSNRPVPNLMHLDLQHCGISELNASLLPNLMSLYLDNNNFVLISDRSSYLSSLKLKGAKVLETLSVSHNRIMEISANSFDYNTNLLTLDLSHNLISVIPEGTFDRLHQLQSLSLENNQIELSSVHAFRGLVNLENLYLGGNDLSNISSGLFKNLSALKKLMLNSTKISSIDVETFSALTHLEVLSLAGNQLSTIPDGSMPISGSLINLNLDNNKFTSINDISSTNTPNMHYLSLRHNPLSTIGAQWFSNVSESLIIILGYAYDLEPAQLTKVSQTAEITTTLEDEYDY